MICDCDLMNTGSGDLEYLGQSNHEIACLRFIRQTLREIERFVW